MSPNNSSGRNVKDSAYSKHSPNLGWVIKDILIVVKTYPIPSKKNLEVVCTAGVTKEGEWIRIYPLPFRYLTSDKVFKKYQWITAKIRKRATNKDKRKESYEINYKSIKTGPFLNTSNYWEKRKEIVLPTQSPSLEELTKAHKDDHTSLGIFKPKRIDDLLIKPAPDHWKPQQELVLKQGRLFDPQPKILEKIPWKFSYVFHCDNPKCRGHTSAILDWEIFQLYRNLRDNYQYAMDEILEKIRQLWLEKMWSPKKDSYLIVGTTGYYPTFNVLGVFWPSKKT